MTHLGPTLFSTFRSTFCSRLCPRVCSVVLATILVLSSMRAFAGSGAPPPEEPPGADEPGIELRLPDVRLQPTKVDATSKVDAPNLRSPVTGVLISLLSTMVPTAIGAALLAFEPGAGIVIGTVGLTLGPSMGHFYAGDVGHGFATFGLRAVIGGAGFGLWILGFLGAYGGSAAGAIAGFAGSGLCAVALLSLAIYDIATAHGAVRRANERANKRRLVFAPTVAHDNQSGATRVGLALSGRF